MANVRPYRTRTGKVVRGYTRGANGSLGALKRSRKRLGPNVFLAKKVFRDQHGSHSGISYELRSTRDPRNDFGALTYSSTKINDPRDIARHLGPGARLGHVTEFRVHSASGKQTYKVRDSKRR